MGLDYSQLPKINIMSILVSFVLYLLVKPSNSECLSLSLCLPVLKCICGSVYQSHGLRLILFPLVLYNFLIQSRLRIMFLSTLQLSACRFPVCQQCNYLSPHEIDLCFCSCCPHEQKVVAANICLTLSLPLSPCLYNNRPVRNSLGLGVGLLYDTPKQSRCLSATLNSRCLYAHVCC